jgi:membrane peptidoglycan carboxypeptidase
MRRTWIALGVGVPAALALGLLLVRGSLRGDVSRDAPSIARLAGPAALATAPPPPTLQGIDLTKIALADDGATAALPEGRTARLTLDPALQRAASGILTTHHVPEAAIVLMDVQTGRILVYASHVEKGPARDLCVEATAPAASVFKVVTGTALVESAGLSPDQRECYSGGEQRIFEKDLVPDPKRDKWCTTLAGAMGRSVNTVFARLALRSLKPSVLEAQARSLGFGAPLPFDVPVQPSALHLPEDTLGYARTAAGFWNTTLSPIHAAWLAATVARSGEPVRPVLVREVTGPKNDVLWTAPMGLAQRRAMKTETAQAVTTMMEATVSDGTSYRAFHDPHGAPFLPGITVAGKTGTLTDATTQRFYTWFMGFAPSKPYVRHKGSSEDEPDDEPEPPRQVAIGVVVVNQPTWNIKANVVAREVLRAYFAEQKVPNVTAPGPAAGRQPSTTPGTKHARQRGS